MEDPELQKMFLSGGVTNILTLGLFFLLKVVAKKCDRNKRSTCSCFGSSCNVISKDTFHERPEGDIENQLQEKNAEGVHKL